MIRCWSVIGLWCCLGLAPAMELPALRVPDMMGIQIKGDYSTAADLEAVRATGVRWVRRGVYWKAVEQEPGVYDFSAYDELYDACQRLGLGMVAVLYGNPNNPLHEDDKSGGIQTEAGRQGFAAFAAAFAARYRGRQIIWEIWNEPNTKTFWNNTKKVKGNSQAFAADYTALVKAVAPAMHAADPDCLVVAGSLSNYWIRSYEWTEYCLQAGILEAGIDGWSVHPYGVKTPEEHSVGHGIVRELLTRYGAPADFPILQTERGFAVKEHHEGWSGGSEQQARVFQAWHYVRQMMVDSMNGIRLLMWYEWQGDKFGMIYEGEERPVRSACVQLLKILDGYAYTERIDLGAELDYALRWSKPDAPTITVVWTAPPAGEAPDATVVHEAQVPVPVDGAYRVIDIDGRETNATSSAGRLSVELSGSPLYLVPAD